MPTYGASPGEVRAPGFRFLRATNTSSSPVGASDVGGSCRRFVHAEASDDAWAQVVDDEARDGVPRDRVPASRSDRTASKQSAPPLGKRQGVSAASTTRRAPRLTRPWAAARQSPAHRFARSMDDGFAMRPRRQGADLLRGRWQSSSRVGSGGTATLADTYNLDARSASLRRGCHWGGKRCLSGVKNPFSARAESRSFTLERSATGGRFLESV